MKTQLVGLTLSALLGFGQSYASDSAQHEVSDAEIARQRQSLATHTKGFGPQAPRDIDRIDGSNPHRFASAPDVEQMNLCNIHFHMNAEHRGGEYRTYAGNGDGRGFHSGFVYSGTLRDLELAELDHSICPSEHGSLAPGDTIELHYVYSTAEVEPGPTLGACMSPSIKNPQLRVEAVVMVLVSDHDAASFTHLTEIGKTNELYQALHLPESGKGAVQYAGSTTGPGYNEQGSPFQVTWNVRPKVLKVDADSVGHWCEGNPFDEDHAHGVRNLVTNLALLSPIL